MMRKNLQSHTVPDNTGDEFLLFREEDDESGRNRLRKTKPWKILVVNDDEEEEK